MAPKRKKVGFQPSSAFEEITPEIEDEIVEEYAQQLGDDTDLHLDKLSDVLDSLNIPHCFTSDIKSAIDYYYQFMHDRDYAINSGSTKQRLTLEMILSFTITTSTQTTDDVSDIIDIDKLIQRLNTLIKLRNNYSHIISSWKSFIQESGGANKPANIEDFQLTLPELKNVKTSLNLDNDPQTKAPLNDGFLIDMLGCCQHDQKGHLINFAFDKQGASVMIKDFAVILGKLGELDDVE
ncbi:hypothetical protein CANMA_003909 [Candida margitis]|uniref:uncharacterized protein n=1 Tax=Candida margitis TaxID=1775924 RepID=UPI002227AF62|nr:uncharacterized protein CANMA_003909 [Candida margitis]KAI5961135.1 hypothetical protein CANMA_003909 [Candida margitis]